MIAISSSTKKALIAVEINNKQKIKELDSNCKHAENILKEIDNLLEEINEGFDQNDCFAVVIGPGSFTGIRIALALIKGFVFSKNSNIISLTTFDLMAKAYLNKNNIKKSFICVINALGGLYYICKYNRDGEKIGKELLINEEQFKNISEDKVVLNEENIDGYKVEITAEDLLKLAKEKMVKKEFTPENKLFALYLRRSQAEENLANKNIKNS